MKNTKLLVLSIIIASSVIGFLAYPNFPDMVASHWDQNGNVNGYMPKFWGTFLMPIISLIMFGFFLLIPKIDPLRTNIESFRKYYDGFIVSMFLFLFYIHILTIAWNLGHIFNMSQFMAPALGILFYSSGVMIGNTKRNWFIGIKTPWTVTSDVVWDKTHKLGAKLFKIAGLLSLLGMVFPSAAIWLVLIPVSVFSVYLIFYSYLEYQKEIKK